MNNVVSFYEKYDEEARLTSNNARKVEFYVTTTILNQYIKGHSKILELGAGTGVYSFYYADRENDVLATDITPKHIGIIKQKLSKRKNSINLSTEVLDAANLSNYKSESFDVVLCLGPMYHLTNALHREKCIKESLRVLKKNGILAIAYINKHFVLNTIMTKDKKFLTNNFIEKVLNTGVIKEGQKECFWTDAFFTTPIEMESFITKLNTQIIDHVGTDGLSPFLKDFVDNMNEKEYSVWLNYSLNSCREKSILGMSNHGLLICKK
ncbi:class I SAM-dependent methyltransferase [Clostridium sp. P21]|uniref:Class I SAM-dependent methyltransferase n=1 Tax=Clostridium muellerianum TaxID=2716538 RepID=A0A7Y0HMV8_9CLOT|nr:class I SAM-dependent methyltransferase [Clostridium muellerianum]NMM62565.1 class I SAM-dependent methyltransferase [Clostridium muellerianum]